MSTTPATTPHRAPAISKGDGSMVRVLVVDDEHSLTELLKMALQVRGLGRAHRARRPAPP